METNRNHTFIMETAQINRLVLIGNGFDLAHGLKTRYNDFIIWYLTTCFTTADKDGSYKDLIISIEREKRVSLEIGEIKTVADYVNHFYKCGFPQFENGRIGWKDALNTTYTNPFRVKVLSSFFRRLLDKCNIKSWVEIENEFYEFLKELLEMKDEDKKSTRIEKLNKRFGFIIHKLEEYLITLDSPARLYGYSQIFKSDINMRDIVTMKITKDWLKPASTMFLNFNYTSTLKAYSDDFVLPPLRDSFLINFIHGAINEPRNPLIFGFGDELDPTYEKMEKERIKGFLTYIKSFWYFKTSNYHKLVRFIDSAPFQVVVLGHSCGLSDRTMLNMIFENKNCISVKIYYYGDKQNNNFSDITQEISRHFTNKQEMRRKIVPFDRSEPMPQAGE